MILGATRMMRSKLTLGSGLALLFGLCLPGMGKEEAGSWHWVAVAFQQETA
jgi:hypothetical protein